LTAGNTFAAALNKVLSTVHHVKKTIFVHGRHIASVEFAVTERVCSFLRRVPVAEGYIFTFGNNFAYLFRSHLFA
jgi:hypothetical protein